MEGRKIKRNLNEELTQVVKKKKKGRKNEKEKEERSDIVKLRRFDAVCRNIRR